LDMIEYNLLKNEYIPYNFIQPLHGSRTAYIDPLKTWGNSSTLAEHFKNHGKDFASPNSTDYARQANRFFDNRMNYQMKIDSDGIIRVYDKATNTFGSYNADGSTKTYFKPTSKTYWDGQPGVLIK